ncbi:Uncharacterized protein TCM_044048 [Theobroma cacao]|uniref:Uncharacterized protein n=1 Tax=Theobroma cacao TaxID=3641 RepID=A0A061FPI2_THECC|nr:Uncharacterized protein TCM_044048 [Theobroma cacao]
MSMIMCVLCHDPKLPIEPVTIAAKPRQTFFTPNVDRNLARLSYKLSHFPGAFSSFLSKTSKLAKNVVSYLM